MNQNQLMITWFTNQNHILKLGLVPFSVESVNDIVPTNIFKH